LQFACRDLVSDEVLHGEVSCNGITMTSPVCGNGDFVTAFTAARWTARCCTHFQVYIQHTRGLFARY
jgi:hypothetical protein